MLDIILRTCQRSDLDKNVQKDFTRICGTDRRGMVIKCVTSLVNSIVNSGADVRLTILDDRSDADFVKEIKALIKPIKKTKFIKLKPPEGVPGFTWSSMEQFRLAAEAEDLVYTIEDDYLHEPTAIGEMLNAFEVFSSKLGKSEIMIFPFDCPFRYESGREQFTILFHSGIRYWRHVAYTTYSFLTRGSTVKAHEQVFQRLAREYPKVTEDDTINRLYSSLQNQTAPITVFNPIPSLAYHLSYAEPRQITTPYTNWKTLWETI